MGFGNSCRYMCGGVEDVLKIEIGALDSLIEVGISFFAVSDSGIGHPRCVATLLPLCSEVFGLLYSGKTKLSTLRSNCFCYYVDVHEEYFGYLLCSWSRPFVSYLQWESSCLCYVNFLIWLRSCECNRIIVVGRCRSNISLYTRCLNGLRLVHIFYFWYRLLYSLPHLLFCRLAMEVQVLYRYPVLVFKYIRSSWVYSPYMVGISLCWMLLFGLFKSGKPWDIHSDLCTNLRWREFADTNWFVYWHFEINFLVLIDGDNLVDHLSFQLRVVKWVYFISC